MENQRNNPLLCDIETGLCQLPPDLTEQEAQAINVEMKPIKLVYYTDPICSTCWGIEPQLRKLKLYYGNILDIEYRMGGLLPDWSYNSGGISKPSDVATHWDEVSLYYDMPIDGNVWLEDPLSSSYPPSIAFKAAQLQDTEKAIRFLRAIREMVFLRKKNITKWAHLSVAAQSVGLDVARMQADLEDEAKALFMADLDLGRKLGVRGFPTLFFVNDSGRQEVVYGFKDYSVYEQAIVKLYPPARKNIVDKAWASLFSTYPSLTSREFSELSDRVREEADTYLQELADEGHLNKVEIRNGVLWTRKHTN